VPPPLHAAFSGCQADANMCSIIQGRFLDSQPGKSQSNVFAITMSSLQPPPLLRVAQVCSVAGVPQSYHSKLVKSGDLAPPASADGCNLIEAIQFVLIRTFIEQLGSRDGRLAFARVREHVDELIHANQVDLVYDKQFGTATIAFTDSQVATAARCRHDLQVVDLTSTVRGTTERFHELVAFAARQRGGSPFLTGTDEDLVDDR
jgi:hypothetical protein